MGIRTRGRYAWDRAAHGYQDPWVIMESLIDPLKAHLVTDRVALKQYLPSVSLFLNFLDTRTTCPATLFPRLINP